MDRGVASGVRSLSGCDVEAVRHALRTYDKAGCFVPDAPLWAHMVADEIGARTWDEVVGVCWIWVAEQYRDRLLKVASRTAVRPTLSA